MLFRMLFWGSCCCGAGVTDLKMTRWSEILREMKRLIQRYCPSLHATHSPLDLGDLVNLFNFALESFTTEKKYCKKISYPVLAWCRPWWWRWGSRSCPWAPGTRRRGPCPADPAAVQQGLAVIKHPGGCRAYINQLKCSRWFEWVALSLQISGHLKGNNRKN